MPNLSKLSRSIKGSVALITGAASGMGQATAYLFADEGARLILVDVNAAGLQKVAADIIAIDVDVVQQVHIEVDPEERGGSAQFDNVGADRARVLEFRQA